MQLKKKQKKYWAEVSEFIYACSFLVLKKSYRFHMQDALGTQENTQIAMLKKKTFCGTNYSKDKPQPCKVIMSRQMLMVYE